MVGFLASLAEKRLNAKSLAAVSLAILGVGLSIDLAMPESTYSMSIALSSPQQEFEYLEVYLPTPHLRDEPYEKLFEDLGVEMGEMALKNYTLRIEETEHGEMLVLGISSLPREVGPLGPSREYRYEGVAYFSLRGSYPVATPPYQKALKLQPRYHPRVVTRKTATAVVVGAPPPPNVTVLSNATNEALDQPPPPPSLVTNVTTKELPLPPSAWQEAKLFDVPIKVVSKLNASVRVHVYLSSSDSRRISQAYWMSQTYSESFEITLEPSSAWAFAEAEVMTTRGVGGFGN